MKVVLKDLDHTRIRFEAMIRRFGEKDAVTAASRAMNHEGRKVLTAVRRTLVKQTSIPRSIVVKGTKLTSAHAKSLKIVITGRGAELPMKTFGAKQFKYGVRAKVWGRLQTYKSNFIVASQNGDTFHRETSERLPIGRTFGPSIGKEIVKDDTVKAFDDATNDIAHRVMHELSRILKVR